MDTNYFGTDGKCGGNHCQFRGLGADKASNAPPQGSVWSDCEYIQSAGTGTYHSTSYNTYFSGKDCYSS